MYSQVCVCLCTHDSGCWCCWLCDREWILCKLMVIYVFYKNCCGECVCMCICLHVWRFECHTALQVQRCFIVCPVAGRIPCVPSRDKARRRVCVYVCACLRQKQSDSLFEACHWESYQTPSQIFALQPVITHTVAHHWCISTSLMHTKTHTCQISF